MSKVWLRAGIVVWTAAGLVGCGGDTASGGKKTSSAPAVEEAPKTVAVKPAETKPSKPVDLLEPPPPVVIESKDKKKPEPNKSALILPDSEVENVGSKQPELPNR